MEPDPELVDETQNWLVKAGRDLRAARLANGAAPPLRDISVFHAQQAAEKALKAFLTWHERPFAKTHDLEELRDACIAIEPALRQSLLGIGILSEYAVRVRYPGESSEPPAEEAEKALRLAQSVFDATTRLLPAGVWPPQPGRQGT